MVGDLLAQLETCTPGKQEKIVEALRDFRDDRVIIPFIELLKIYDLDLTRTVKKALLDYDSEKITGPLIDALAAADCSLNVIDVLGDVDKKEATKALTRILYSEDQSKIWRVIYNFHDTVTYDWGREWLWIQEEIFRACLGDRFPANDSVKKARVKQAQYIAEESVEALQYLLERDYSWLNNIKSKVEEILDEINRRNQEKT